MIGTALVAASASALNQRLERRTDALMHRTADRPLPAGRLVGSRSAVVRRPDDCRWASAIWRLPVNPLTAALGAATWVLYVVVYTPLKTRTPLNTVVGAVAGALPTLMGWAAVGGSLSFELGGGGLKAATLFLIVFLWQFPHFMAIAWIYRRQYAAGRVEDADGGRSVGPAGRHAGGRGGSGAGAGQPGADSGACRAVYFAAASALGLIYLAAAAVVLPAGATNDRPGGCCGSAWFICRRCWCCSCWSRWSSG